MPDHDIIEVQRLLGKLGEKDLDPDLLGDSR